MPTESGVQKVVQVPATQAAAQQLAAELKEMEDSGVKPDETQPGGYYLSEDGETPHDAHGNQIKGSQAKRPKGGWPRGQNAGSPGQPAQIGAKVVSTDASGQPSGSAQSASSESEKKPARKSSRKKKGSE